MREKVEEVLNKIRPQLEADGGNVELVEVSGGTVQSSFDRCLCWLSPVHHDLEDGD